MLTDAKVAVIKPPAAGQEEHRDNKVTGLRLRVGSGGKKSWIVRARAGAKVVNKKVGVYPQMGLAAARAAAEKVLAALAKDGTTEAIERTFGAVAEHWINHVAKMKNGSWRGQERILEMHVYPHWKERKIAEIRRGEVRELLDGIEGIVLPNRVLATIRPVFRHALSRDWIEASPAEGIKSPRDEVVRERVLDLNECKRIWDAAGLLGYPFTQYIRTLMLTGQRRAEVAGMKWADVDLEAATWTLASEDTKSGRGHLVPLSAPVVAMLEVLPRLGEYVFTTDGETHVRSYSKTKARLDTFIAAKGGEMAPWRLHDLRRTAATEMVRLGITTETVGRVLNHAPQGITAKVYALHEFAPEKRSALDRWAAELMRAVESKPAGKVVKLRG